MRKEVLMILLIVGLPTMFIMTLHGGPTGLFSNEMANARSERLDLYLTWKPETGIWKTTVRDIREGLRMSGHSNYYRHQGLQLGDEYFQREMNTAGRLLEVACLKPSPIISEKTFRTPAGFKVRSGSTFASFKSVGQLPCEMQLVDLAEYTLGHLLQQDYNLIVITASYSNCPDSARETILRARDHITEGNVEEGLNNLHAAWRTLVSC